MNYIILFLILPLFSAFLAPVCNIVRGRFGKYLNIAVYAAGAAGGIYFFSVSGFDAYSVIIGGWKPPYGINLYLGPVAFGFGILIYFIAFLIHIYDLQNNRPAYYHMLFALFVFASLGMTMTGDLFNLFIFIEIGTIALLGLSASVSSGSGARGALKYFVPAALVSMIMLAGIALLYSSLGTLNIAHIARSSELNGSLAFLLGIGILGIFFFEAELFPFNTWVPDLYRGAPSSIAAGVAGIGGIAGVVSFGRVFLTMMAGSDTFRFARSRLTAVVFIIAAASIVIGELAALKEEDVKKVLAFSSVSHMGIVVLTFSIGGSVALTAGLFILLNHSVVKPLMLMTAGFYIKTSGKARWREMRGIARRYPLTGALFVVGALSLMGMPLFAGFWGKMILLKDLFSGQGSLSAAGQQTFPLIGAAVILFSVILEGTYFMRIGHVFFEAQPSEDIARRSRRLKISLSTAAPALILALVVVLFGLRPGLIEGYLSRAASDLINTADYINNVLVALSAAGGAL